MRKAMQTSMRSGAKGMLEGPEVIQPGDLLWTDFGITYLGLNTDTQHNGYVLREGESDAPAGVKQALANANFPKPPETWDTWKTAAQGATERHRPVRLAHVQGTGVRLGVDRHAHQALLTAGAQHAHGDLPPVGDQHRLEHHVAP